MDDTNYCYLCRTNRLACRRSIQARPIQLQANPPIYQTRPPLIAEFTYTLNTFAGLGYK